MVTESSMVILASFKLDLVVGSFLLLISKNLALILLLTSTLVLYFLTLSLILMESKLGHLILLYLHLFPILTHFRFSLQLMCPHLIIILFFQASLLWPILLLSQILWPLFISLPIMEFWAPILSLLLCHYLTILLVPHIKILQLTPPRAHVKFGW